MLEAHCQIVLWKKFLENGQMKVNVKLPATTKRVGQAIKVKQDHVPMELMTNVPTLILQRLFRVMMPEHPFLNA